MAAPAWFVEYLEELRRLPGARPTSARTLADWAAQVGNGDAPSRATVSRWLSGATLPTSFEPLEVLVSTVRERTRTPTRQARETLLRSGWWREVYERALIESGRGDASNGHRPPVVYQGMDPFGRADAARFFGRGRAIEAVRDRLDALWVSRSGTPLVVLGPSGVGKSSLLAAGVLPALETGGLPSTPEIAQWPSMIITPGSNPLRSLSSARAAAEPSAGGTAEPRGMVLVVDQFEELFQADAAVQDRFLAELLELAEPGDTSSSVDDSVQQDRQTTSGSSVSALVVLVCRNDFYPELRQARGLGAALDRPFNLDALSAEELAEAILKPARQAGISVGQDLVTRIVSDAGVATGGTVAGQLPLISHVLRVMNQAGPMTVRAYERVGGIDGAVAYTATRAWEALRRSGLEATALALLVRLVRVGDYPGHDARRQLDREELLAPGEGNETEQALRILSAARLVTSSQDTVQITHDALLLSWDRLRDTIDNQRAELLLRQNVELRARQWDDAGRPPEQLLRGTVLEAAHGATDDLPAASTTDLSREFLVAADVQERRIASRRRRLRLAAIAAVVLIIAAGTIAVVEGVAEYRVNKRVVLAEVLAQARVAQQNDPSLAAQLYLTAYRMQPDPFLYTALLDTENQPLSQPLHGHQGVVHAVAPVGGAVASAGEDGTIRVWAGSAGAGPGAVGSQPAILTEPGAVSGLAALPGRSMLVSAEDRVLPDQSTLRVWDIRDARRPLPLTAELPTGAGHLTGLSTSPDGKLLAATAADGTVRLWDINDPTRPIDLGLRLPGATHSVYGAAAAVSSDDRTMAVAGDAGTIELFDITDPARPAPLPALPSGTPLTHSVAFNATGTLLVSAGANGALRLWDTSNPSQVRLLAQPASAAGAAVLTAAFSPDGSTLAAGSSDNKVTLWNISDPARMAPLGQALGGDSLADGALAFGPESRTLFTGSGDGTVRVWSLPATRLTSAGTVGDVEFSHSGRVLAVGDTANRAVSLWDTTNSASPAKLVPSIPQGGRPGPEGFHLAFTADDAVLAASGGQTVRFWDVRDPRRPTQLGPDLVLPAAVGGMDISPDGRTLAAGAADGVTRLYDIADPARPVLEMSLPSTPGKLAGVTRFSPDGRTLATTGEDYQVWLWDTTDPARAHLLGTPLTGHFDTVFGLAFSPDGQRLVSVSTDHTLRVWDLSDRLHAHPVGAPIVRQGDVVGAVAYSAVGSRLATGSNDRTVALWNTENPDRPTPIGSPLVGHNAKVYAVQFRPGGQFFASGGADRTAMLWTPDVDTAIQRLCAATTGTLTREAWSTFVSPDEDYDPPCGVGDAGDH